MIEYLLNHFQPNSIVKGILFLLAIIIITVNTGV